MSPNDPNKPPKEASQRWEAPECPFTIDYSTGVLNQIRQRAEEAFYTLPHGGLEIGGVLFGRVSPNARSPLRLEIVAERPIDCRHADGPWFVLSDDEKGDVAALLDRARLDPELSAFSVAGFWVSHGRGDLTLSAPDLDLYANLFANPWQVVLVLKPALATPTRGAFFFRSEGEIAPHEPGHSFVVGTLGETPQAPVEPPTPATIPVPLPDIPIERREELILDGLSLPVGSKPFWTLRKVVVALMMLLAAEMGAGLATWWMSLPTAGQELNLEVFAAGQELLVHWNPKSHEVARARSGELVFNEAKFTRRVPLDSASIQRGFLRYRPSSRNVSVILRFTEDSGRVDQVIAVQR